MKRVLVCGGRDFHCEDAVYEALGELDETWEICSDGNGHVDVAIANAGEMILSNHDVGDLARARAKLAAAAPEMARMLLDMGSVAGFCGCCEWCKVCGSMGKHKDGCEWVALMKKAGVLE